MANIKSADKRARQAEKLRAANTMKRSTLRTYIKKVYSAIESKDKQTAQSAYRVAVSAMDRAIRKNLIHKNKANRYKSRLNKYIAALS